MPNRGKEELEKDIDALFALSLSEFTRARNALAARLKKDGRGEDAARVKVLARPSISAWVVNQLYRKHRKEFDRLIAAGERFREVQASQFAGKGGDTRGHHNERREALSDLSRLAAALLRDAGHSATSETMRRISTTLEAMSAYASLPDAPAIGRLSTDVDPPGFEALAALIPAGGMTEPTAMPAQVTGINDFEDERQARISALKLSLQHAERRLNEVRVRAESAKVALKEANLKAKEARAASEEADRRAAIMAAEVEQATKAVEDAERAVEKASNELRSLFPKSSALE